MLRVNHHIGEWNGNSIGSQYVSGWDISISKSVDHKGENVVVIDLINASLCFGIM